MLMVEGLLDAAMRATGLEDFGGDGFREGLAILVSDINADKARPEEILQRNAGMITKTMMDRLRVVDAIAKRPEVLQAPVRRPVFVFGAPRTGTTLLSNLLAADPARRSPLKWELEDPVPPPTTETLYSDPRALAAVAQDEELLAAYPEAGRYNPWRPLYPHECVLIMAHEFKTLMWESAGKLPNYRDFVFRADMRSAYEYHKKWLQLHQADAPGIWNLKMPSHALYLETLLSIYPDARLVWTHRDPVAATGSLCSLITTGHMAFAGHVDMDWIAGNYPQQAAEHVNRAMQARARIGHDRIIDVQYAEMVRDPLATLRKLYNDLGDAFTPEAEAGVAGWLAANPQGKFGKHEYQLSEYGLSAGQLQPLFEPYLAAYDVEREG